MIIREIKQPIKECNWDISLNKKEKKEIHRDLLRNFMIKNYKCKSGDIIFSDNHDYVIDDILRFKERDYYMEYKTDYKSAKTGNLVFELISSMPDSEFPNIHGYIFRPHENEFKILIDLVNNVRNRQVNGARISRHLNPERFKYYFSYASTKNDNYEDVKSVSDIHSHHLFRGDLLSKFIQEHYLKRTIIVTKSKDYKSNASWHTVSCLVSTNDVLDIEINKNNIDVETTFI